MSDYDTATAEIHPNPPDVTDDAKLRVLDAADEADRNAVIGHTHVRIRPDETESEEAERQRRREHRAKELLKRGQTRDGPLRPLLRPKLPVILLLSNLAGCGVLVILYMLGAPFWVCALAYAIVLSMAILGYVLMELMLRYPCIVNTLLLGTGICEDLRRTSRAAELDDLLVPSTEEGGAGLPLDPPGIIVTDAGPARSSANSASVWNLWGLFAGPGRPSDYLEWDRARYGVGGTTTDGERAKAAAQSYCKAVMDDLESAQEATREQLRKQQQQQEGDDV
jgi:hypothetical protein